MQTSGEILLYPHRQQLNFSNKILIMNWKQQYAKESLDTKQAWIAIVIIVLACLLGDNL